MGYNVANDVLQLDKMWMYKDTHQRTQTINVVIITRRFLERRKHDRYRKEYRLGAVQLILRYTC